MANNKTKTRQQASAAAKRDLKKRIAELEAADMKTPQTAYDIGMAYAELASLGGENCFEKAFECLAPVEPFFADQAAWQLAMAQISVGLRMFSSAVTHFEAAFEIDASLFDRFEDLYLECVDRMSHPNRDTYGASFQERIDELWRRFEKTEADCRACLAAQASADPQTRAELQQRLYAYIEPFGAVLFGASVVFEQTDAKPVIRFRDVIDLVMLERVAHVIECAPAKVLEQWSFAVGSAPNPHASIPPMQGIGELKPEDVYVVPARDAKTPDLFELSVFIPGFIDAGIQAMAVPGYSFYLNRLIFQVLGDVFSLEHIKEIRILDTPPENAAGAVKLSQAREAFEAMGLSSTNDYQQARSRKRSYQVVNFAQAPSEFAQELPPRYDILRGETSCYDLAGEFFMQIHPKFDGLFFLGAAAGFFAWRAEDFESDAAFDAFADQFIEALRAEAGKRFSVIGRADGLTRRYVDIIAWDPERVIAAGRKVMDKHPADWSFFQVMRPAKPVLFVKQTAHA